MSRAFVSLRRSIVLVVAVLALPSRVALAQGVAGHVARGDAAAKALATADALTHYESALVADSLDFDALWRIAQLEAELAEYEENPGRRVRLESRAAEHARAAVRVDSTRVESRFALARVLGQLARTTTDPMTRSALGRETYEQVTACLAIETEHAGCLLVLGGWHASVSALDPFSLRLAATLAGSDIFARASWTEAERNLLKAVKLQPTLVVPRLELGRAYAVQGKTAQAKAQLEAALKGTVMAPNDARRKREAKRELDELAGR